MLEGSILFEGSSRVFGGSRLVTESALSSPEVTAPYRVLNLITLAPILVLRSPHALGLLAGLQGLHVPGPRKNQIVFPKDPLVGFSSPSEAAQAPSRRLESLVPQSFRDIWYYPNVHQRLLP